MVKLSVIVPVFRRDDQRNLERTLSGLERQTLPRDAFEVLVVDDGSPVPPDDVVLRHADGLPVTLLKKPNGGLASARNRGAARATGDVLLFLDDDVEPCADFLEQHLRRHEDARDVVVLGALPLPDPEGPGGRRTPLDHYLERVEHYDLFRRFGSAEAIPLPPLNGNSSVRREHFEAEGGYDETFAGYGGEDAELGHRLAKRGLRFVHAKEARGFHHHGKTFDGLLREMEASGETMVALVRKHPEVRDRANLDLVDGPIGALPWGRRLRRLAAEALARSPRAVALLEAAVRRLERLGWSRLHYLPCWVACHHRYAVGMRRALGRDRRP